MTGGRPDAGIGQNGCMPFGFLPAWVGALVPLVTPTPGPGPGSGPESGPDLSSPWVVSPGIEGFIMFAILGLALWGLIASMVRHIRKVNFRAAEREEELYGPVPGAAGGSEQAEPAGR